MQDVVIQSRRGRLLAHGVDILPTAKTLNVSGARFVELLSARIDTDKG